MWRWVSAVIRIFVCGGVLSQRAAYWDSLQNSGCFLLHSMDIIPNNTWPSDGWNLFRPTYSYFFTTLLKFSASQKSEMCRTTSLLLKTGKPWSPGTTLNSTFSDPPSICSKSLIISFLIIISSESPKMKRILLFWDWYPGGFPLPLIISHTFFQSDSWCHTGPCWLVLTKLWRKPRWLSNCHCTTEDTLIDCLALRAESFESWDSDAWDGDSLLSG